MSEIHTAPVLVTEDLPNKSIADLVAEGLPLSEVAVTLRMSVVDVLRWYSEMAAVLHVHDLPSLVTRLRGMDYGPVAAPVTAAPISLAPETDWDIDDLTPHLTPLMSVPTSGHAQLAG